MKLPKRCTISIEAEPKIVDLQKRGRQWCSSLVASMVWLSSHVPNSKYVFRGHADAGWDLRSSLLRSKQSATLRKLEDQENALLDAVSRDFWFSNEFGFSPAGKRSAADYEQTVAALQHHGVPTRLLDVTADPLVALYFAVIGHSAVTDRDEQDGAVIMIRNVSQDDSLPIHVIPAPQVSPRVTAQRSLFIAPSKDAKVGKPSNETVAFDFFNMDVSNQSNTNFDNLAKKFLRGDFQGRPAEKAPNVLMFTVPGDMKSACRQVLHDLGVSARFLFPGSEGFRRDLAGY